MLHIRDTLQIMARVLIVAYGNPLRCDDGIAWRAAEMLEGKFLPDEVEIVSLHQLGPELAESASRRSMRDFYRCGRRGKSPRRGSSQSDVRWPRRTSRRASFLPCSRSSAIIGLAIRLYGTRVQAFSVTITGQNFDHGESLSPAVKAALPNLIERIHELIQECLSKTRNS